MTNVFTPMDQIDGINYWFLSVLTSFDLQHDDDKGMNEGLKFVVIFAYMRTGSTFLGKMFGSNPNVFFTFEPIGPLYFSMFGTRWSIRSDINYFKNGSKRFVD